MVYSIDQEQYVKDLLGEYDVKRVKNIGSPMASMSVIKSDDEHLNENDADVMRVRLR